MFQNQMVAKATEILQRVDVSFRERPVYILAMDNSLPPSLHLHRRGWTAVDADLFCEPELRHRGAWAGRGFCCAVRPPAHPGDNEFFKIVLHEGGHHLAVPESMVKMDLPHWQAHLTAFGRPPKPGHDSRWARASAHIAHRACTVAPWIFQQAGYGTTSSPESAWAQLTAVASVVPWAGHICSALADELESCRHLPIRQILSMPAPAAFAALWQPAQERYSWEVPASTGIFA